MALQPGAVRLPAAGPYARGQDHHRGPPRGAAADLARQARDGEEGREPPRSSDALAIAEGHRSDDPTTALTAALPRNSGKPTEHLPSLPAEQLGPALARLSGSKRAWPVTIAALRFIAATACRSGEARHATWDEIDLDAATWTIPAERTKTQRPHVVPLSAMAVDALEAARLYSGDSGLIFESPTGRALTTEALSKFTRPEAFTPHGMRASFRSWAAEQGVPREVAEAALAHTAGAVERAYQRSDLLAVRRQIMIDWSGAIE